MEQWPPHVRRPLEVRTPLPGTLATFGEMLKNYCEPGDLLIGCTASGMSPNIINAMKVAREMSARTVALVGYEGGAVNDVDQAVIIPSDSITQIEDLQMLLFHLLASALRDRILASL
jgi:DNA-binding MurR/RpiR family transcriptional regulator